MNHYTYEQWLKYVNDEIEGNVREFFDDHLYSCEQCLALYLQVVEDQSTHLPVLSNEDEFTNLVMAKVKSDRKVIPFHQKTIFHYIIAAAMTLLLMSTGVFQSMTKYVDHVENPLEVKMPSMTEGLVNKTFAWMDSIDITNKEGNQ